jgi:hypothetical protein
LTPTPTPNPITQCQNIKLFKGDVAITSADVHKGDTVTFRGFASATGTTVSKIRFTVTIGSAVTTTDVNTTLVGGMYQADHNLTIDTANTYSVAIAPVSP